MMEYKAFGALCLSMGLYFPYTVHANEPTPVDSCLVEVGTQGLGSMTEVEAAWASRNHDTQASVDTIRQALQKGLGTQDSHQAQILLCRLELAYGLENISETAAAEGLWQASQGAQAVDACLGVRGAYMLAQYLLDEAYPDRDFTADVIEGGLDWAQSCADPNRVARMYLRAASHAREAGDQLRQAQYLEAVLNDIQPSDRRLSFRAQVNQAELIYDLGETQQTLLFFEEAWGCIQAALADGENPTPTPQGPTPTPEVEVDPCAEVNLPPVEQLNATLVYDIVSQIHAIHRDLGQFDAALAYGQETLDWVEAEGDASQVALTHLLLTWTYLKADRLGDAQTSFAAVDPSIFDMPGIKARHRHLFHFVEGMLLVAQGDALGGSARFDAILASDDIEPEFHWRIEAEQSLLAQAQGDISGALKNLWQVIEQTEVAQLAAPASLAFAQSTDPASQVNGCDDALGQCDALLEYASMAYRMQRRGYYRRWLQLLSHCLDDETCGQVNRRSAITPRDRLAGGQVDEALLLVALDMVAQYHQMAEYIQDVGGFEAMLNQMDSIILDGDMPLWAGAMNLRRAEDLQSLIPEGVPIVLAQPLEEHILLVVATHKKIHVERIPLSHGQTRRDMDALAAALQSRDPEADALLELWGERLLDPILPHIDAHVGQSAQTYPAVGFILRGALSKIPVAALRLEGSYLVEAHTPFELTSLRSLGLLPDNRLEAAPPRSVAEAPQVMVLDWSRSLASNLQSPLHFADIESVALAKTGMLTESYGGPTGSLEGLVDSISDYAIVHFATHAQVSEEGEAELHLFDRTWRPQDLSALDLHYAYLVFLNGCKTGVGYELDFDAAFGSLYRAALQGGASAVIGTRWDVDDGAAFWMAQSFYEYLPEMGRAAALAAVQRDMLSIPSETLGRIWRGLVIPGAARSQGVRDEKYPAPLSHPSHWAAWSLMGRWD